MKTLFLLLLTSAAMAQTKTGLEEMSAKINRELPENWDSVTRLMKTTVVNNNVYYHFILRADQVEFDQALPKVKQQVLSSICRKSRELSILRTYKANIVYKYESEKGPYLGEFMIKPEYCSKN